MTPRNEVFIMVEFVEAGTEQAADLGWGDDAYFSALERKVKEAVDSGQISLVQPIPLGMTVFTANHRDKPTQI
jgi:hypothetical protein